MVPTARTPCARSARLAIAPWRRLRSGCASGSRRPARRSVWSIDGRLPGLGGQLVSSTPASTSTAAQFANSDGSLGTVKAATSPAASRGSRSLFLLGAAGQQRLGGDQPWRAAARGRGRRAPRARPAVSTSENAGAVVLLGDGRGRPRRSARTGVCQSESSYPASVATAARTAAESARLASRERTVAASSCCSSVSANSIRAPVLEHGGAVLGRRAPGADERADPVQPEAQVELRGVADRAVHLQPVRAAR